MNAPPTDFARPQAPPRTDGTLGAQWAALQEAASAVAGLAGLAPEKPSPQVSHYPALIERAGGWRHDLATDGITDLFAMMRPGLQALFAVSAAGRDPTAAALTLWREYHHARAALLALVPESTPQT
ncbi:hypothetical protein ACWPM1_01040 [Tsuneonella sp. HG249]